MNCLSLFILLSLCERKPFPSAQVKLEARLVPFSEPSFVLGTPRSAGAVTESFTFPLHQRFQPKFFSVISLNGCTFLVTWSKEVPFSSGLLEQLTPGGPSQWATWFLPEIHCMINCCIFNFSLIREDAGCCSTNHYSSVHHPFSQGIYRDTLTLPGSGGLGSILLFRGQQTASLSFFLLLP